MFQDYFIHFCNDIVYQCNAMNVLSHTEVLKNLEGREQNLLKRTLFIFRHAFLIKIKGIFGVYLRVYIADTSQKLGHHLRRRGE